MKHLSFDQKRHWAGLSPLLIVSMTLLSAALRLPAQNVPEIVWETNAHYGIHAVAFAGDGQTLVSGAQDQMIKVWSKTNAVLIRTFQITGGAVLAVALSADGNHVAAGDGGGGIRLWRVADGVRSWQNTFSEYLINSVAFSHDGSRILETRGFLGHGKVIVRDSSTGYDILLDGENDVPAVYSGTFSPDDAFVASGGADQTAKLWRLSDNSLLRTLTGHSNTVYSVEFSPDGTLLATTSSDGTARLWRVPDGSVVRVFQGGGGSAVKFSSDGRLLLTLNGGPISLWRVSNGQWLHTYTNANASALDVASDGKHFVYGRSDGAVVLARLPLWIIEATYQDYAVTLRWQGGSGRYQVQARNSLTSGNWQNLGGPTTNRTFSSICLSPMFYRVQSLTNI